MKRTAMLVLLASATLLLQGCKTGYNKPLKFNDTDDGENARTCDEAPRNSNANLAAIELYNRLRNLSCTNTNPQGVLMGQSAGAGDHVEMYYQRLFTQLTSDYQLTPAVISVDYEHDMVFSDEQLTNTNNQMVLHGGIISISWSPMNPWVSIYSPGFSVDELAWTEEVDLDTLLDTDSEIHNAWMGQVDRIANLLNLLQNDGVAVLWRPLPEMNSPEVWWGVRADINAASYKKLWKQVFDRFQELGLNNLLWVYSPVAGTALPTDVDVEPSGAPFDWAYPGNSVVDIIAPVIQDNDLDIADYSRMTSKRKPLGLAEYGPSEDAETFEANLYGSILAEDYPAIAYWVSSHSAALIDMDQDSLNELEDDDYILQLDDIRNIKAD